MPEGSQKLVKNRDITNEKQTCFIIMPIADHPDYLPGHFSRVYEYIIKPACADAGFLPDRADDAQHTHIIMMNILQRILDADIVLCDLSTKNPNVLYELGIRQAFDKPVTLIKDDQTTRIFDTGMLSDVEYSADLRIDNVQQAIKTISARLWNTFEKKDKQINSLIQLMKIQPAKMPAPSTISSETSIILDAIATLGNRILALEEPDHKLTPRMDRDRYFSTARGFHVTLKRIDDQAAETFISLFDELYPFSSCSKNIENDGSIHIKFTFNEGVKIHVPALDKIMARAGVQHNERGILTILS